MSKQIDIKELIPKMKPGYVVCDEDGTWNWFSDKCRIKLGKHYWYYNGLGTFIHLSAVFNIISAKDWTKSLIKVGE